MEKKFDVITIGSATRDVYLASDSFIPVEGAEFQTGQGICVNLGSKIEVKDIHFTTGGGAVNVAITFALQGLRAAAICKVGDDARADAIEERLKEVGVAVDLVIRDKERLTAYSVIIHAPDGERSIFVYRGASSYLNTREVDLSRLEGTSWIYVTHMAGESAAFFAPLMEAAKQHDVKVAFNPGSTQLRMGKELVPFLNNVDILFLNREEASVLTGIEFGKEQEIFKQLDEWVRGIAVMTKGPDGVTVSDGATRWDAPALKEPRLVDRTGAGDAFGSGFTTAIIQGKTVEEAMLLGSANATRLIGEWGSNIGLLTRDDTPEMFGALTINTEQL
ncbi:MAG: carbohydrate kinase family protein [Candidatus Spechtbacterales bacterium]